jgi:hypothetical protein
MTPNQIKLGRYLITQNGLDKDEAVHHFTGGRTTHLSEMTKVEFMKMVGALKGESPRERMTRKVLSMAHEMGWELHDGRVDMTRVNAWCRKYTKQKKDLDKVSEKDLPALVTVFEKVYVSFLKGI